MSDYSTPAEDAQGVVAREPDPAPGLVPCPRCTDGVVDLVEHLTWCKEPQAAPEPEADRDAPEPDPESARLAAAHALIEEDRQRRMAACLADIEEVLDRHGMSLDVQPARVILVPKD